MVSPMSYLTLYKEGFTITYKPPVGLEAVLACKNLPIPEAFPAFFLIIITQPPRPYHIYNFPVFITYLFIISTRHDYIRALCPSGTHLSLLLLSSLCCFVSPFKNTRVFFSQPIFLSILGSRSLFHSKT